MKSKATLSMIEFVIMILVFALSLAICLKVFAYSDNVSRQSENKGIAYAISKNTAETIKACRGDMEKAADILGYEYSDGKISCVVNNVSLSAQKENTDMDNLGGAVINAVSEGDVLCSIHIRWQEGLIR